MSNATILKITAVLISPIYWFTLRAKQPGRNYGETFTVFFSVFLRLDLNLELPSGHTSSLASSVASTEHVTHPQKQTSHIIFSLGHINPKWKWNSTETLISLYDCCLEQWLWSATRGFQHWQVFTMSKNFQISTESSSKLDTFLHCQICVLGIIINNCFTKNGWSSPVVELWNVMIAWHRSSIFRSFSSKQQLFRTSWSYGSTVERWIMWQEVFESLFWYIFHYDNSPVESIVTNITQAVCEGHN